jgi:formiminoglutamase
VNARDWLAQGAGDSADIVIFGAPISKASISPSNAWSTPPAFRQALGRFNTWDAAHRIDVSSLTVRDLGDVSGDREDAGAAAAHERILAAARDATRSASTVVVIGGDNSVTRPAMQGLMAASSDRDWGLLTLDAHHDCRPLDHGPSNGTPVRELIESGLAGDHVAQVGIHPFANDPEHARWAVAHGVNVFGLDLIREDGITSVIDDAVFALRRAGSTAVYVDIDIDVVDRAFAPACPASMPGGLTPTELLTAVHRLAFQIGVAAADITEVDAEADVNGMTVRLAAAAFLALCSGIAARPRPGPAKPS